MGTNLTKPDQELRRRLEALRDNLIPADATDAGLETELEYPIVSPEEFVLSDEYYGADQRDGLHPDVYPVIIDDMKEIFSGPNYAPKYRTFVDIEGTGSGKSTKAALFTTYSIYRLHCYKDPARALGLRSKSIIAFINMAPTADQAKRLVFTRVGDAIKRIRVFTSRGWLPNPNIESYLDFPKRILVVPGNSSKSFSLGYDLYGGIIDEAEHFTESVTTDPVEQLYCQLNDRRESRFHNDGLIVLISDARTAHCYLEKLASMSKSDSTIYFKRRSRWEAKPELKVHPTFEYAVNVPNDSGGIDHVVLHPPEIYRKNFEERPGEALRTIAAIPTMTLTPFFGNWAAVIESLNQRRADPAPDNGTGQPLYPADVYRQLPGNFRALPGVGYFAHVDLARSRDAGVRSDCAGFAICHRAPDVEAGGQKWSTVVLDLAVRFKGSLTRPVKFSEVRELIYNLDKLNGFKFVKITYDGWQSIESLDELSAVGYNVDKRSVGIEEFIVLRDLMYGNRLDWFSDQWLLHELQTLEDLDNKVAATLGEHDDESFAVAGAVSNALGIGGATLRAKKGALATGIYASAPRIPGVADGKLPIDERNRQDAKGYLPSWRK